MTDVRYCTRERVQETLQQAESLRNNRRIDDAIAAASRNVEGFTYRKWYPTTAVRYPDPRRAQNAWILWLDEMDYEILSITSLVVDGVTLTEGTHFYLEPEAAGPPYTSIRLIRTSSAAWSMLQRAIVIAGAFGANNATVAAGTLASAVSTTSGTQMSVSDSSLVGVGDLVTVGSERVIVTEKTLASTTATLGGSLAAQNNVTTVAVSDGTLVLAGEVITVGSERMFVESIAGNNLTVRRGWSGSTLAAHSTNDAVYAPRLCTITRAATGSTASTHSQGDALARNSPPALVQEATLAIALNNLEQGKTGYARTLGAAGGDATPVEATGRGVASIIADCMAAHGRRGRIGVTS